jgi:hypothetical protein
MTTRAGWVALSAVLALGCDSDPSDPSDPGEAMTVTYDFADGAHGWTAGFADYPAGQEEEHGLEAGLAPLPAPLDGGRTAFHIEGVNRSDDLFMYLTREVEGLRVGGRYRVAYEIQFATDAPRGCIGVGGSPGESVFVKAGAAPIQPLVSVDAAGHARLNVDHGAQSQEGAHARMIGDVSSQNEDCGNPIYQLKTLSTTQPLEVTAASDGALWLIVGTDSGFESRTSLYYTQIQVTLTPVG